LNLASVIPSVSKDQFSGSRRCPSGGASRLRIASDYSPVAFPQQRYDYVMDIATRGAWLKPSRVLLGILAVAVVCVVLIPALLIAAIIGFSFFDDWNYSRLRTNVDSNLVSAGFRPPIPDATSFSHQPDISFDSPDQRWTLVAQWVDTRGYNWGFRNNQIRKVYFLVDNIRPDNAFSPRLGVLWSPKGNYVAVTTVWGANAEYIDVIHMIGSKPTYTKLSMCASDSPDLLNEEDRAHYNGWCGKRSEALKWENDTDLEVLTYIDVRMTDESERAVAAHEILRFDGDSYVVSSKKYDFYETLPEDD
jgi:hypothetical protein